VAVTHDVAGGLSAVRRRIESACRSVGRDPSTVRLVAVSKRHDAERVRAAYAAGQRVFGENYVQELVDKAAALADLEELRWHFVGHLQRNKVKNVLSVRAVVETVDSLRLGEAISKRSLAAGVVTPVLVQVNVGGEAQKSGCDPAETPSLVAALRLLGGLDLRGLRTVPPETGEAEGARPHFRRLRELGEATALSELSMGMSHDLEVAVEEGATIVRVGTAIFGPRPA
jgi:pyridoxal phosphate enzyme (YggS family)